jgi:hypothetical protein
VLPEGDLGVETLHPYPGEISDDGRPSAATKLRLLQRRLGPFEAIRPYRTFISSAFIEIMSVSFAH